MPSSSNHRIYPVILAGGGGTRLWPSSRSKSPKQFIPLLLGKSLFQETCLRFKDRDMFAPPTIITNEEHRFLVRNQLQEIGIVDAIILTEPKANNTLPACLSGALFLKNQYGNVPILFAPSDHTITNEESLYSALQESLPYVLNGSICLFGITPTSPHTGYGYITQGEVLSKNIIRPGQFIEKPEKAKAEELIQNKALWNSGMYFCTADTLYKEALLYTPTLHQTLQKFFSKGLEKVKEYFMIPDEIYMNIDPISIDKGITEHSDSIIMTTSNILWSDLGSWSSLHDHFTKDANNNVIRGDVITHATKNSYIESTSRLVTTISLDTMGVIETPDAVLVFPLSQSEHVKKIVEELALKKRNEIHVHTTVHRPWGTYEVLGGSHQFKSKKITVLPGAELSLQRHTRRAEHWIIIEGIATVTRDNEIFELQENQSTFLPMGSIHRLQNKHDQILVLVEVQTGTYFGEDDIERFEDIYGRT